MSDHETRNTAVGDANRSTAVDRREFMKSGAATSVAALVTAQAGAAAAPAEAAQAPAAAAPPPPAVQVGEPARRHASDYMVDIFKSLDMEYMFAMCASSFIGIHESIINYAGNKNPEGITCTHEEISVAMANGYAKIEGKPVLVCLHATVGTQHAAMAVYDAWCDRVPVYLVLGNTQDATQRNGDVYWLHSAQDPCALVRDMTKWDDNPVSLAHFAESAVRAYKIAMTPPYGPVAIVVDDHMQQGWYRPTCGSRSSRSPRRPRAIRAPSPRPRACWWRPRTRSSSPVERRARRRA